MCDEKRLMKSSELFIPPRKDMLTQKSDTISSKRFLDAGDSLLRILGRDEYVAFVLYILRQVKHCQGQEKQTEPLQGGNPCFVVFITRRCHVLKEIVFKALLSATLQKQLDDDWFDISSIGFTRNELTIENIENKLFPLCRKHFITDFNFLSMDRAFAQYFDKTHNLPDFIIADEILLHGRAMNKLLLSMEEQLMSAYSSLIKAENRDDGTTEGNRFAIRACFREHIRLDIYAQKQNRLLLLSRYAREGTLLGNKRNELQWRKLSLHFAQVVSVATVNNVGFSLSFVKKGGGEPDINKVHMEIPPNEGFLKTQYQIVQTHMQDIPLTNHIVLFTLGNELKAAWSFRIKESPTKGHCNNTCQMAVPYFMTGTIPTKYMWKVFLQIRGKIFENLERVTIYLEDYKSLKILLNLGLGVDAELPENWDAKQFHAEQVGRLTNVLLNYILLKKYLPTGTIEQLKNYIDYELLQSTYSLFEFDEISKKYWLRNVEGAFKLLWSLDLGDPTEYLNNLLLNSEGVDISEFSLRHPTEDETSADSTLENNVLDVLYQLGVEAEKHAHERISSSYSFSEHSLANWGVAHSIMDVLDCYRHREREIEAIPIFSYLAELIHAMDLGIISMTPKDTCEWEPEKNPDSNSIYTMVKAGEQALFIKPIRYRNFIPVLSEIEKKHYPDRIAIMQETHFFALYCIDFVAAYDQETYKKLGRAGKEAAEDLSYQLTNFLHELYTSGQTVSSWMIPLSPLPKNECVDPQIGEKADDSPLQDAYIHQFHRMYGYY